MSANPHHPYLSPLHKIIDALYQRGGPFISEGYSFTNGDVIDAHKQLFPEDHLPFKAGDRVCSVAAGPHYTYKVAAARTLDNGKGVFVCVPEKPDRPTAGRFGYVEFIEGELAAATPSPSEGA